MKVEMDLPENKGYEYTGEFRSPLINEYYLDKSGFLKKCLESHEVTSLIILRKVEAWRDAEMPRDFEQPCRYKEKLSDDWVYNNCTIRGQDTGGRFLVGSVITFQKKFCQVLED